MSLMTYDSSLNAEAAAPAAPEFTDVGVMLQQLREQRGLSVSDVSRRLKYSEAQLCLLEQAQFDQLPKAAALRGMVRNYARYLKVDEHAVLAVLDKQAGTAPRPPVPRKIKGSWAGADTPLYAEEPRQRAWGWGLIIALLLFVAAFYALDRGWIPDSWLFFDWLKELKK
jgi:cytoskeletal protein RodZ